MTTDQEREENGMDVETILTNFRHWLSQTYAEAEAEHYHGEESGFPFREAHDGEQGVEAEPAAEEPEFGLLDLVEEFTALRHELKLQTKSARGLQEQSDALLSGLRQAIEQFRGVEPKEEEAAFSAGKALARALANLDEALERNRGEIEKAQRKIAVESTSAAEAQLVKWHAQQSWLRRRLNRGYHQQCLDLLRQQLQALGRQFDSFLEGFDLIRNRMRRALKDEQIVRIPCVGQRVDPERMTVVEVVDDAGVPPGQVIEEVRRGYTWRGRVIRFAEVRAARQTPYRDLSQDEPGAGAATVTTGQSALGGGSSDQGNRGAGAGTHGEAQAAANGQARPAGDWESTDNPAFRQLENLE